MENENVFLVKEEEMQGENNIKTQNIKEKSYFDGGLFQLIGWRMEY